MKQNQSNWKFTIQSWIIISLSILGLIACIVVLFPQVRNLMVDLGEQILHKEIIERKSWIGAFLSFALGGICLILIFDYCALTKSGKMIFNTVKQEISDCLSDVDFCALRKPLLIMLGVYLLGILTIIRANYLYQDDIWRSVEGVRKWYNWSRYVSEFFSIFLHGDTNLTEISPLPQLLAILILSVSSVLLVYIVGNKKITTVRLLASIPLGLFPYFLECLSFKYDAPYMALSILACVFPFLFINRKKAFVFISIISLLIMCMTYQAASGIYLMVVLILCFQDWNGRMKPNKDILSFLGVATFAFCLAMLLFNVFFMRHVGVDIDDGASIHPLHQIIPETLHKIKEYILVINQDLGVIWKMGIMIVCFLFIIKSIYFSSQKKIFSFSISILFICIAFLLSHGVYFLLRIPFFYPRAMYGLGVMLAILCIYVVSDYKKIAVITVLALNWCFFVFAFSFGNALADQARYSEFRTSILLHDLSALFPDRHEEGMLIQLENSIDYVPSIKNISKHYPVIERLIYRQLGADFFWDYRYYLIHFNFRQFKSVNGTSVDLKPLNLPVVLDSYYHTIKSDGTHCLVILKN